MNILITGHNGFIGKNLLFKLQELGEYNILTFGRNSTDEDLIADLDKADIIIHLAGVNRPKDNSDFQNVNRDLTIRLCEVLKQSNRKTPIVFTSSIQANIDNPYGSSKKAAEEAIFQYSNITGAPVYIFRLPNVIGKWCKPNYNSAVATFCYNIANNLPIIISDPQYQLSLVYVDDIIEKFCDIITNKESKEVGFCNVNPVYTIKLGELSDQIKSFRENRKSLLIDRVGTGFLRALYSTYISYLPSSDFSYKIKQHIDTRGTFAEMLKTKDSGQFSFFTVHPGITRGEHYHHTKTEKFLVIMGKASFKFRNIITNEFREILTSGEDPEIVDTIPGWAHDITNVGNVEMIVMLWANEIFDNERPDTIQFKV